MNGVTVDLDRGATINFSNSLVNDVFFKKSSMSMYSSFRKQYGSFMMCPSHSMILG